jgi:hypothetical protein
MSLFPFLSEATLDALRKQHDGNGLIRNLVEQHFKGKRAA